MKHLILLPVLFLAGCVVDVQSRIDSMGNDIFHVVAESPSGFSNRNVLENAAIREADDYCRKSGLQLYIINDIGSERANVMDDFPRVEIRFKCVP